MVWYVCVDVRGFWSKIINLLVVNDFLLLLLHHMRLNFLCKKYQIICSQSGESGKKRI
jgi:hypothetical protein